MRLLIPFKLASGTILGAFAALALVGAAPASAKTPSTSSVNSKVQQTFNAEYDEGGKASCRKTSGKSWSCKIRTDVDRANVASGISSGNGTSVSEMQNNWYSYICTARYSGGRINVGEFRGHDYDTN